MFVSEKENRVTQTIKKPLDSTKAFRQSVSRIKDKTCLTRALRDISNQTPAVNKPKSVKRPIQTIKTVLQTTVKPTTRSIQVWNEKHDNQQRPKESITIQDDDEIEYMPPSTFDTPFRLTAALDVDVKSFIKPPLFDRLPTSIITAIENCDKVSVDDILADCCGLSDSHSDLESNADLRRLDDTFKLDSSLYILPI